MQLEGMLHVEERLGTDEQEHVAACCRDASRQAARPVGTQRQSRKAASVFCDLEMHLQLVSMSKHKRIHSVLAVAALNPVPNEMNQVRLNMTLFGQF